MNSSIRGKQLMLEKRRARLAKEEEEMRAEQRRVEEEEREIFNRYLPQWRAQAESDRMPVE